MPKFKHPQYTEFLKGGFFKTIPIHSFIAKLNKITGIRGNYIKEARALMILIYYTGCRPGEAMNMYQGDIYMETDTYIVCNIPTLKNGVNRKIYLRSDLPLVKEMYDFCWNLYPKLRLFVHYYSEYKRTTKNKKGVKIEYIETSDKLRYYVMKWFGTPTYYFRHNRLTILAERDIDARELKYFKGSKKVESVEPYLHVSTKKAKRIADINR